MAAWKYPMDQEVFCSGVTETTMERPMGTNPPTSPWAMRRKRSCQGEVAKPWSRDEAVTVRSTTDITVFGPRRSAWMDQKGAEKAIMKGVTPTISPAQNAASPGSVSPISERKRGRKDMTPTMEIPAPTWIRQVR